MKKQMNNLVWAILLVSGIAMIVHSRSMTSLAAKNEKIYPSVTTSSVRLWEGTCDPAECINCDPNPGTPDCKRGGCNQPLNCSITDGKCRATPAVACKDGICMQCEPLAD